MLNEVLVVMITPFDLFGYGLYRYTFQMKCEEIPELKLDDGATRIFLNTRGKNDSEVSEELVSFLHYIENTTDAVAENSGSERIKRIHNRVRKVKVSEEVGVKYMQAWEEKYYEREEGREEGAKAKLQEQIRKKLEKGKSVEKIADELEESTETVEKIIKEMEE